jgi:hypothetical protein
MSAGCGTPPLSLPPPTRAPCAAITLSPPPLLPTPPPTLVSAEGRERLRKGPHAVGWAGQPKYFLYGAPKNYDHYGLSIFCMDKR